MRRSEIRFSGFGGQGIITAGYILGKAAALYDQRHVTLTKSYGPESRGGASSAQVIISDEEINSIVEDAKQHSEEDRRRAELIRVRSRLEGLVESNQKTFSEFGSMLAEDKQLEVRRILDNARKALDTGSMAECTEALEKIAEVGQILSEVILYDPSSLSGAEETEADTVEEV